MRSLPRVLSAAFLATSVFVLASCSSDGDSPLVDRSGDEPAASSTDTSDTAGGSAEIDLESLDFPIPAPADPVLVIDDIAGALVIDYSVERYDEILAFYTRWVADQPGEWSPTPPDTSEGSIWFSLALEGEPEFGRTVTVVNGVGSDDERVGVVLGAPEG